MQTSSRAACSRTETGMTAGPGEKLKTRSVAVAVGMAGDRSQRSEIRSQIGLTNREFKWFGKIGVGGRGVRSGIGVTCGVFRTVMRACLKRKTLTLTLSQRERERRF